MRDKRFPIIPTLEQVESARKARCVRRHEALGLRYRRYSDDHHGVPRGTIILEDQRIVPGYPRIGRILVLDRGVRGHFAGEFDVEEKIDGYNVRIVAVDGRLVPFTRNGLVCPFTADRLPDLLDRDAALALFAEQPDLVLCAEVAGPDNPYIDAAPPRVPEDVSLFAFDFMRCGQGDFIAMADREKLFSRHGLPRAPYIGRFKASDVPRLKQEILRLDAEGGEGMVLKPVHGGERLKYVTPSSTLVALRADASLEMELPGEFFTHRIARLAIGLRELGLRKLDHGLAVEIGESLLRGFESALDEFERTGEVAKHFSIKVRSPDTATLVLDGINRGSRTVRVREIERHQEGRYTRVVFAKTFRRSTDILDGLLSGRAVFD